MVLPGLGFAEAAAVPGEDQSSYKAELFAFWLVLQLILRARRSGLKEVNVLSDCEAAITAVCFDTATHEQTLPGLLQEISGALSLLRIEGVIIDFHWVPSHGRAAPKWRPWDGLAPDAQRALNARADETARAHCTRRCRGAARVVVLYDYNSNRLQHIATITDVPFGG